MSTNNNSKLPFTQIVAFGDSWSDAGNYSAAIQAVGKTFDKTLSIIPNTSPYANGRFSSGYNWVDHLSESVGLPKTTPARLVKENFSGTVKDLGNYNAATLTAAQGNNWAWGAAPMGTGETEVLSLGAKILPRINQQISDFSQQHLDGFEPHTLVTILGGGDSYFFKDPEDHSGKNVANLYLNALRAIAEKGAHHILVVNQIDLTNLPAITDESGKTFAENYNAQLEAELPAVKQAYANTHFYEYDLFGLMSNIVNQLSAGEVYRDALTDIEITGLTRIDEGGPATSAFTDNAHPSDLLYQIVAAHALKAIETSQVVMK